MPRTPQTRVSRYGSRLVILDVVPAIVGTHRHTEPGQFLQSWSAVIVESLGFELLPITILSILYWSRPREQAPAQLYSHTAQHIRLSPNDKDHDFGDSSCSCWCEWPCGRESEPYGSEPCTQRYRFMC